MGMSSIVLTADTLLGTTPAIGSVEFDGKAFYATAQGTQRGIIPGAQFFRLNADLAGLNATGAQNTFGVSVTLSTSTIYAFECVFALSKITGTTSRTIGLGFGGSATLNNIAYYITGFQNASATPVTTYQVYGSSAAGIALGTVSTASNTTFSVATTGQYEVLSPMLKGTVSINGGGTFTPQYTLSAAPGGAYSTLAGSYFLIDPIGASGANISVGAWA
jgi:hypothetical protein